jgi:hypothetical protein
MSAPLRITRPGVRKVARGGGEDFKEYLGRLMKLIPGEVVGLYLVGSGFIPKNVPIALAIWTVVCLLAVIVVTVYGTTDPEKNEPPDWIHVFISSVSFVIWVYTLGGAFIAYNLEVPYIGSLVVLAWTFFVPIFYQGPSK